MDEKKGPRDDAKIQESNPVRLRSSLFGRFGTSPAGRAASHLPSPAHVGASPSVSTVRFTPKLSSTTTTDFPKLGRLGNEEDNDDDRVDFASMLAHSLTIQNSTIGASATEGMARAVSARSAAVRAKLIAAQQASTSSVSQRYQQHLKRIKRGGNAKKSKDLKDLSFPDEGDKLTSYPPISLPFIETDEGAGGTAEGAGRRPTSKLVDEANRNAAKLFDQTQADPFDEFNRTWILVQFPPLLPALDKRAMEEDRERRRKEVRQDDAPMSPKPAATPLGDGFGPYVPSSVGGLPDGLLGRLLIYASGKARLVLNDGHEYHVNYGSECAFAQDAGCYLESNSEYVLLGRCNRRMIVTPDIDKAIDETKST